MGYDLSGCPIVNDFSALEIQVEDYAKGYE